MRARHYLIELLASVVVSAALGTAPAMAAPGDQFERLLFPLVVSQFPGAYGTVWDCELSVRNVGNMPVEIFTSECAFRCDRSRCVIIVCPSGQPTPPDADFPDVNDLRRGELGSVANPATLLYVERGRASDVVANLRLVEATGPDDQLGLEVPVVRENELFTGSLWLLDVPMRTGARTHLRLYGVESPSGDALVRLRAYEQTSGRVVLDRTMALFGSGNGGSTPRPDEYDQDQPAYALFDLSAAIDSPAGPVRIRVDPITEGLEFWVMASVTSNTTQQVTLVTPQ